MEFPGLRPMARELGLSYNTIKYYIKNSKPFSCTFQDKDYKLLFKLEIS